MSRSAGLLVAVPALFLAALVLSSNSARASEKEVMEDVVVKKGDTVKEVSTAWGDVLVEGEVEEYVRSGLGDIEIKGPVGGNVEAGSGDVYINAPVKGDVKVGSGDVELGPEARVEGDVSCGGGRLARDPSAVVIGVERAGFSPEIDGEGIQVFPDATGWALMALVLAALAVLATVAVPRPLRAATRSLELSPGRSLVLGLGSCPVAFILIMVLGITVIGIPVLFLLIPAYLALVFFGLVVTAYFLGRKVVLATRHYRAGDALAAAVGAALVAAAYQIPILGGLVFVVLALIGAGATFSALLSRWRPGINRPTYASYEDYLNDRRDT